MTISPKAILVTVCIVLALLTVNRIAVNGGIGPNGSSQTIRAL